MKYLHSSCTILFGVAVLLFFGLVYPHHLHYQEQYQLFLFDSNYLWEIVKQPGGVADLLGRFCTQFFLFAWVSTSDAGPSCNVHMVFAVFSLDDVSSPIATFCILNAVIFPAP